LTVSAASYGEEVYATKPERCITPRLVLATCWYGRPKPKFNKDSPTYKCDDPYRVE
jgi:hypothetical protein